MSEQTASRRSTTQWEYVAAVVGASSVAAAFAGAHPTGLPVVDVVYCALFGGFVTWMAACSRRWVWLPLSGAALVLAGSAMGHLLGAVALGFAMYAAIRSRRRDRLVGAVVGGLSVQALLRTSDVGFHGFTALVTGALVVALAWSAYGTMRRRNRRRFRIALGSFVGFTFVALTGLGVTLYLARHNLEAGITKSQEGLDEAQLGQQAAAARSWNQANEAFNQAHSTLGSPITKLSYLVPVASQHAQAITTTAGSGVQISADAVRAATVAPYRDLRSTDGRINLDLVRSMQQPVAATATTLHTARHNLDQVDPKWLVPALQTRLTSFRDDLDAAIPDADRASRALDVAPGLLGGSGTRRYLVLFGNPSETRGLGGFIGAWAELDATDGKLTLARHGKMGELNDATDWRTRTITGQPEYLKRYGYLQPARFLQNMSASPDFPTVSDVAEQLYPQAGGTKVDGVLYVDPYALAALLELTGPVTADGVPFPLTSKNAADYLLHGQYLSTPNPDERSDVLSNAAEATFTALTTRKLPTISAITDTLSPLVHQRRLLMTSTDHDANRFLASIGLTGAFPSAAGGDLVSVRTSNGSANKADYYLHFTTAYGAKYDPRTGHTTAIAQVAFTNQAPAAGEPDYVLGNQDTRAGDTGGRPFGSDTVRFSIYSPLYPGSMSISGKPVTMQVQKELGTYVASATVTIPPGGNAVVTLDFAGDLKPSSTYRIKVPFQPMVNDAPFLGKIIPAVATDKVRQVGAHGSSGGLYGLGIDKEHATAWVFGTG